MSYSTPRHLPGASPWPRSSWPCPGCRCRSSSTPAGCPASTGRSRLAVLAAAGLVLALTVVGLYSSGGPIGASCCPSDRGACSSAGCLKAPSTAGRETGCRSCHEAHYVREGACRDCHRGNEGARRAELAHERLLTGRAAEHRRAEGLALREGQRLVETLACRRCHAIGGKGNRLATSLDAVVWRREQAQLVTLDPRAGREHAAVRPRRGAGGGDRRLPAAQRKPRPAPGHLPRPLHPRREPEPHRLREGVRRLPPLPRPRGPRRHRERPAPTSPASSRRSTRPPPPASGRGPTRPSPTGSGTRGRPAPHATMPPVALGEDDLRKVTAELGGTGPAPR